MDEAFARLHVNDHDDADEFERPIFRSANTLAYDEWEAYDPDGVPQAKDKEPAMRGLTADGAFTWDFHDVAELVHDAPPPRLIVNLMPHREEGADEWLVHNLKQFTVTIGLADGATGAAIPSWASQGVESLSATLVYADTGEPVPAQKGEPPLSGDFHPKCPHDGDNYMRLKVSALSYYHARRLFAVRIDAHAAPGSRGACFACSHPVRGVARLPSDTKPATTKSAAPSSVTSPFAAPLGAAPPNGPGQPVVPSGSHPLGRICPPTMPTVGVLDDDNEESFDTDEDEDEDGGMDGMMVVDADEACVHHPGHPGPHHSHLAPAQSGPNAATAYTYTSRTDIADELRVQGRMLEDVSAQQQFIIGELARMRSSNGLPPPPPMPPLPGVPYRAAMCA